MRLVVFVDVRLNSENGGIGLLKGGCVGFCPAGGVNAMIYYWTGGNWQAPLCWGKGFLQKKKRKKERNQRQTCLNGDDC